MSRKRRRGKRKTVPQEAVSAGAGVSVSPEAACLTDTLYGLPRQHQPRRRRSLVQSFADAMKPPRSSDDIAAALCRHR